MYKSDEEIVRLVQQFNTGTLPKSAWTHAAHLTVAVWHLDQYGHTQAMFHLRNRIRIYNTKVGTLNTDNSGYHETLTWFWLWLVAEFVKTNPQLITLTQRCNGLINTGFADASAPLCFYSKQKLFSTEARHGVVIPDLQPLRLGAKNI
jgi:hypothetical protein